MLHIPYVPNYVLHATILSGSLLNRPQNAEPMLTCSAQPQKSSPYHNYLQQCAASSSALVAASPSRSLALLLSCPCYTPPVALPPLPKGHPFTCPAGALLLLAVLLQLRGAGPGHDDEVWGAGAGPDLLNVLESVAAVERRRRGATGLQVDGPDEGRGRQEGAGRGMRPGAWGRGSTACA